MSQAESPSKVSKSQQVVLTLPPTLGAMVQVVQPALDRLAIGEGGVVRLLVLVPDADTAHQLAAAVRPSTATPPVLVPVTSPARGVRLLAQQPVALVGAPREIAALLPSGQLKLGELAQLLVLQGDLVLATADAADLEAIMGELPKELPRTLTIAQETDAVAGFVKAWLKRPRRVGEDVVADDARPLSLQFVPVAPHGRELALRRILDATNAPSVIVACEDEASAEEATAALRVLGYPATEGSPVRTEVGEITEHSALRVLWDVPATRAALEAMLGGAPVQAVALAMPRQVAHLRALLAGGSLAQLVLTEAIDEATRDRARRTAQLEATLAGGLSVAELQAVEGLLETYDAVAIAAAALRLLDQEQATVRALRIGVTTLQPKVKAEPPAMVIVPATPAPAPAPRRKAVAAEPAPATEEGAADAVPATLDAIEQDEAPAAPVADAAAFEDDGSEFKLVWISVGARDGTTAGSLVGAITGETGLDRSIIGAIDLRETHSLVEIATPHAAQVVAALSGSVIRGRDVTAKIDTMGGRIERAPRGGPRKFDRGGDRPQRGGFGGGGFGGKRPFNRDDRGDRGDRPPRGGFGGGPRRFERDDRGERPQRSGGGGFKRPFDRDERGPRPFNRDERAERPRGGGGGFGGPRGGGRPFERDDRPRGGRPFERDDRGPRGGFDRDRGPRGGGGGGFRRDDAVGPSRRGFDRRPDDFAERAERLERSRRPGGRARLPFDEAGE